MTELVKIFGGALLALSLSLILKETGRHGGEAVGIAVALAVSFRVVFVAGECVKFILELSKGSGVEGYVPLLLKAGGIAYLTDMTAQLCRGAGEGSLGGYVELAGRAELLLLALPLVRELLDLSFGVLSV